MIKKNKQDWSKVQMGTKAVWAGEMQHFPHGATLPQVSLNVAYSYEDLDSWYDVALGKKKGHIYGRNTNPTVEVLEEKMRLLDHAEAATSFSTGMAAISNSLYSFLTPGKRVVTQKDTYGGASNIFLNFLPQRGVDVQLCETSNFGEIEKEIRKGCDVLYLETPTNPTLKILDIERLAQAGKSVGAIVIVDNTFATPMNQRPLELGADLVIYSATKFLCGHADALGGIACGKKELIEQIFHYREINGATLHPMSAYLILRGLKTLELRMERHNQNGHVIAEFLQKQPSVNDVFYPGLPSHLNHKIARNQMSGFGGVLSFTLKGDYQAVKSFLPKLNFAHLAAHLGSVDTIAGPPRTTSHVENTPEERQLLGIPENLIRYAVGIENVEDLVEDLEMALASV